MIRRYILALVAISFVVFGCSKKGFTPGDEEEPDLYATLKFSGKSEYFTKAYVLLPQGLELGVYLNNSGAYPYEISNANTHYTVDGNGALIGGPTQVRVGQSYDVFAYAPYVADIADYEAVPFNHDVNLIYSPRIVSTVSSTTPAPVQLVFEHKMAQITFTEIVAHPNFPSPGDIPLATFEAHGFYPSATLNIITGAFTPDAPVDNTIQITELNRTTCFIPSGQPMKLQVNVSIRGEIFPGSITNTFEAGKSYSYIIRVSSNTLTPLVITAQVVDWIPVGLEIHVPEI